MGQPIFKINTWCVGKSLLGIHQLQTERDEMQLYIAACQRTGFYWRIGELYDTVFPQSICEKYFNNSSLILIYLYKIQNNIEKTSVER